MATRAATRDAARAQSTRSGRVPQELIDELIRPGLGQKDVRLRSLAPTARRQEAIRRLNDPETTAGKPGTNLCRYAGDDKQMTGKRPGYYNKRNISASAVRLCKELVDDAWSDPAFLKEEKLACGDDKKWVFAHQRGDKRVKGHCRKVDAPRPRAKKAKPDPRQKELAALIRKRDKTSNLSEYSSLDKQVKALRAQMVPKREPVLTEPDDISQFDFSVVRPNNQPRRPPPTSRPVAVSTRRTPTVITASMQTYIDSLPRGEQRKAQNVMTAYRNFAGLDENAAIARYEQRRESDAQAPVGATEFDDSGEEDQELGEFGSGLDGGAFDAERRALRDRKNELAHRRRLITRFDTWEDDSWLDPDRSGPPNSNLNQMYDDTDLVDDAEERLMAARAEHAEMGDNALVGSQLSEMLAGQGLFSYPGEDLISDGLSHLAGAIHNI